MTAAPEPALDLLTGDGAGPMLGAVVEAAGGEVVDWRARQVNHQPGQRTVVSYTVRVRWADGTSGTETLGAIAIDPTSSEEFPAAVARLGDGVTEVGVWRFPHDPALPALPAACDADRMRLLAADLGLGDGPVRLRVRAYRPMRRAVVQLDSPRGTVYVKVVRPGAAEGLHTLHRSARAAGCPVPESLGHTPDGLVVLDALGGETLRALLVGPGPVDLDAAELLTVLDALPAPARPRPRRTWGARAGHYAGVLAAAVPDLAERVHAIADTVAESGPQGPPVPVHGDFYESQLMVRDGRVSGLLDIDTLTVGERLDDVGCLLGHLLVLAELHPGRTAVITGFADRVRAAAVASGIEPPALARRTSAVVLSLATGPHRVQEDGWREATRARVALAERELATG